MTSYDIAQYCRNGHEITQSSLQHPEDTKKFCPQCGASVLSACEACRKPIQGRQSGDFAAWDTDRPNHCFSCGSAFPWLAEKLAAADELVSLLDELSPAEQSQVASSLQDIASNGPRTEVGVARLKKLLSKVGKGAAEAVYKVAVDVASEAAKKLLVP
jgi:hypothetical protein